MRNYLKIYNILSVILLILTACSESSTIPEAPQDKIPQALQDAYDAASFSFSSQNFMYTHTTYNTNFQEDTVIEPSGSMTYEGVYDKEKGFRAHISSVEPENILFDTLLQHERFALIENSLLHWSASSEVTHSPEYLNGKFKEEQQNYDLTNHQDWS